MRVVVLRNTINHMHPIATRTQHNNNALVRCLRPYVPRVPARMPNCITRTCMSRNVAVVNARNLVPSLCHDLSSTRSDRLLVLRLARLSPRLCLCAFGWVSTGPHEFDVQHAMTQSNNPPSSNLTMITYFRQHSRNVVRMFARQELTKFKTRNHDMLFLPSRDIAFYANCGEHFVLHKLRRSPLRCDKRALFLREKTATYSFRYTDASGGVAAPWRHPLGVAVHEGSFRGFESHDPDVLLFCAFRQSGHAHVRVV